MNFPILIADSGGTKTDWCLIKSPTDLHYFNSESYHPKNVSEQWVENQKKWFKSLQLPSNTSLFFYGAGCGTDRMKNYLKDIFLLFLFVFTKATNRLF